MTLGVLTIHIHLPGCSSLKEKRSRIKPLINRLHKEFNLSVTEIDHHDVWQSTVIGCALISAGNGHTQRTLQKVLQWIETTCPDLSVIDDQIEII